MVGQGIKIRDVRYTGIRQRYSMRSKWPLMHPGRTALVAAILSLLLGACAARNDQAGTSGDVSACHIIYDAGSSKTRLYVYQSTATGWSRHRGPKTEALADPVRAIRGRSMSDAGMVVDEIVSSLEGMRHDGPPGEDGLPKWPAFDWKARCNIETVAVYATAGMRLAEQQDAGASAVLWKMLNDQLSSTLGMTVTTRTLTGYEEGLFAWLAIREGRDDGLFGVAEMGGASVQITFPCPDCITSRQVKVKGRSIPVYSYSHLGWGQDEALKKFAPLPACARGVAKKNPGWGIADCAAGMDLSSDAAAEVKKYVESHDALRWYLSGAFRYMRSTDIDHFCREGLDSGFQPVTSCFRAVYLPKMLSTLGVPDTFEATDVDWTLGAVICTATRCLD